MVRKPIPGEDAGEWGQILNDFLDVSHTSDGKLRPGIVSESTLALDVQGKLNGASTPKNHAASHATAGSDPITPAAIGAQPAAAGTPDGTKFLADDNTWKPVIDASSATDGQVLTADGEGGLAWASPAGGESARGAGVSRFIERARQGEHLTITCLGDSILEGNTVTNPTTDGAMIRLAADLSARFGTTITQTNHASSGYTAARAHINGNVTAALGERADLYVISAFDKNDVGSDINGQYAPGYPLDASCAAIERIIRAIRNGVPQADIIIMSTNPYSPISSSPNVKQSAKIAAVRRVATVYGCEFVDCFRAFEAVGDFSTLMADGTHPNSAGHRLIADTLLAHLPDSAHAPITLAAMPTFGLYEPETVSGYSVNSVVPHVGPSITNAVGGTGWADEATSTVGDYVDVTAVAREILLQVSTAVGDAAVVDVAIDGVTVAADLALAEQGKTGVYWVPFALGLAPHASHTLRLTLKSGTLRVSATAALLSAAPYESPTVTRVIYDGVPNTVLSTSYQSAFNVSLALPAGWGSAEVIFSGTLGLRSHAATTAARQALSYIEVGPTRVSPIYIVDLAQQGGQWNFSPFPLAGRATVTGTVPVKMMARLTDATDAIWVRTTYLVATLIRTS